MKTESAKKPLEIKSGSAVVRIYETPSRGEPGYTLSYWLNGKRMRPRFNDLEKAKREAGTIAKSLSKGELNALTLRDIDKAIYSRAVALLQPTGVALDRAADEYAQAFKILDGGSLLEAVRFYRKRNPVKLASKTVDQVVAEIISAKTAKGKSDRTIEDLSWRLNKLSAAFRCDIGSLNQETLSAFLDGLGLKGRSYNNFLCVLKTFFRFAVSRKYLPSDWNELEGIEQHEESTKAIEIFTPEELSKLLVVAESGFRDLITYLAICGLAGTRSSEYMRLSWADIDLERGFIKVEARNARKTKTRRLVPIAANLREWLATVKGNGKLWPHTKAYLHERARELAKAAKVGWRSNALRHSFISYRVAETQNVNQTALEAGNSPNVIFSNYRELVTPEDSKKWFNVLPTVPENVVTLSEATVTHLSRKVG